MLRTLAFQPGKLILEKRLDYNAKPVPFWDISPVSLVKPKSECIDEFSRSSAELYTSNDTRYLKETRSLDHKYENIKVRKLKLDKPIFIMYNPISGMKKDIKVKIQTELNKAGIRFFFYEIRCERDAYQKAKTIHLEEFSALAAVGGDGTVHEIINGMLRRED